MTLNITQIPARDGRERERERERKGESEKEKERERQIKRNKIERQGAKS